MLNVILIAILIIDAFERAVKTFHHQVVYDTVTKKFAHLSDPLSPIQYTENESDETYSFLGSISTISLDLQRKISEGEVHPVTYIPFDKSDLEEQNKVPLSEKLLEMIQWLIAADPPSEEYDEENNSEDGASDKSDEGVRL